MTNLTTDRQKNLFELSPIDSKTKVKAGVFGKGRILIGRSESCEFCVDRDAVSAIHAVLEIFENKAIIYDMNSTNGTYVNGDKILVKEIKPGDHFRLADVEFIFRNYDEKIAPPPVLETLAPARPLPKVPEKVGRQIPEIVYPLEMDPKAEFSEYIFEDKETLYPIFKYEHQKQAVEVIILFRDRIFSVDYLPETKDTYYITGLGSGDHDLEFPYFGKQERIPFIDVRAGQVSVHALPGYDVMIIGDNKPMSGHVPSVIDLKTKDIVRFHQGQLQIFVRQVEAPPKVAHAPILKRDPDFQKYLLLLLFLVGLISVGINIMPPPEKKEEDDKAPERLATILYKQPLTVNTNKTMEKTEDAPKVAQKAPQKPAVKKETPTKKQPEVKKPDVADTPRQDLKPDPGKKTAPEKQVVKKGEVQKPKPQQAAAAKSTTTNKLSSTPVAKSQFEAKSLGHVEVYKSVDFSSSVTSLVAKGGSLSGVDTKAISGSSANIGSSGGLSNIGSGDVKTSTIATNVGSLTGSTSGVIGDSKGAEGLSGKKAIYTAGIPSETIVLGSMDPDVIRRILLEHLPQFRYCYQKELERTGQELSGVVKLNFVIGASGHVAQAGVDGDSSLPGDVRRCVVGVLRGIQFPEPMGGGKVEVKQPMNFYPKKI